MAMTARQKHRRRAGGMWIGPGAIALGAGIVAPKSGDIPSWALGTDLWKQLTGTNARGTLPDATEAVSATRYNLNSLAAYQQFTTTQLARTDLGMQSTPTRLNASNGDPTDASAGISSSSGATVTSNATADPFGGTDGDKIDLAAGGRFIYWRCNTAVSQTDAGMLVLRADAPLTLKLRFVDNLGASSSVITLNLTTAWQEFRVSAALTPSAYIEIGIDTRAGVTGGDNLAKTFYIAHKEFALGSAYVASPIRTAGATLNGNRQVVDLTSKANQSEAGLVACNIRGSADTNVLWSRNDGTANEWMGLVRDGTKLDFRVIDGGVTVADIELGNLPTGKFCVAYVVGTNYARAELAGGSTVAAILTATLPTVTKDNYLGDGYSSTRNAFGNMLGEAHSWGVAANDATFAAWLGRAVQAAAFFA